MPLASPGKPLSGAEPKPSASNMVPMRSGGMRSMILAAPMLEDFWITCDTVSSPPGWSSLMVQPPMLMCPGAVWISVSGVTMPSSRAAATVNGFRVEPGSKRSVTERLRVWRPVTSVRLLGL